MDDKPKVTMTDGAPVYEGHKELKPNGQQRGYVVLSEEERAKGFVRPVRRSYVHVGIKGPEYPLRDLTDEEQQRYRGVGYVKFEVYPETMRPKTGRYWTAAELAKIGKGCGVVTTMSKELAETYARNPHFYGGTFCCGCSQHFPVGSTGEFVWEGTDERVGT